MVLDHCLLVIDFRKLNQKAHGYVRNNGQIDVRLGDKYFGIDILKSETEYLLDHSLHKHSLGMAKLILMVHNKLHYLLAFLEFAVNLKVHSNTGDKLGQV